MYTAYPEPDPIVDAEIVVHSAETPAAATKIWPLIARYIETHTGADFAGTSSTEARNTYTHKNHRQLKRKGGHPPKDYNLVEKFVDLQYAYEQQNYTEALTLYFQLHSIA